MNEKQVDSKELIASMPGWFKASPVGITILVETAAREAADRKTTVTRLVAVRAERASVMPALERAAAAARKRAEETKEALRLAEQEYAAAEGKRGLREIGLTMQIQRLECDLHDSAPVEIDDFVREMNRLFDQNRFEIRSSEHAGKINVLTMKRGTVSRSNSAAIHARLRAIQEGVAAAEALKFEFVIPSDPTARLDALRRGVLQSPSIATKR
jgi:hypothetical protein